MSQNRTIKAILALDIDKRALAETEKAIDRYNAILDTTRKRTVSLDDASDDLKKALADLARQDALDRVGRDLAKAEAEGKNFNLALRESVQRLTALGASKEEINQVARAFRSAELAAQGAADAARDQAAATAQAAGSGGVGASFQKLGRFGVELRALPSVLLPGSSVSSDVIGKVLGSVGAGLTGLTISATAFAVSIAPIVVSLGALAVAFKLFNDGNAAAVNTIKAITAAQADYYSIVVGGTRDQLQAARDAKQAEADILRARLDANEALLAEFQRQYQEQIGGTAQLVFGQVGAAGVGLLAQVTNAGGIGTLTESISTTRTELQAAEAALGLYNVGLENNVTALNDAAALQKELLDASVQSIVLRSQAEFDAQKFIETATRESANARINTAQEEINRLLNVNAELAASGSETADALIETNNQRILEKQFIVETTTALLGSVTAREKASAAVFGLFQDFSQGVATAADALGTAGLAANLDLEVSAIRSKIDEAIAKTAEAIKTITDRLNEQLRKAETDRANGLRDAIEKAQDAREKQELAHQDRLLAINRKANMAQTNAIGSRDALAFFLAGQQRKAELTEEKQNNKRRLQEIDKSLKQQTTLVERRYAEQTEAARRAAQASIAIENQKLQILSQQLNAEIAAINQAYATEIALAQNYWNARITTDVAGGNASLSVISQFWNSVLSTVSGGQATSTYTPPPLTGSNNPLIAQYAEGGYPTPGRAVMVGENGPELAVFTSKARVYSNQDTRAMGGAAGGGIQVTINGLGMTDMQVRRAVDKRLGDTLAAARQKQVRQS